MAVGAFELRVDADEALDEIISGGQRAEGFDGRAEVGRINHRGLAWRELFDVAAEERDAGAADLEARLFLVGVGNHDVNAASDRASMSGGWK